MGLDRLIGAGIGIVFKGSGFYETDYKRASEKKSDKSADQGDKSDQSAKSDTTSGTNSADKDSSAKQPAAKKATKPKDS
jgi:predicted nucleic acid-binding Zn ribbon protein